MERANRVETRADKLRAFAYALGVHLLCVLAMLFGLWWTSETRPVRSNSLFNVECCGLDDIG